jgi:hypothetical protein
MFSNIHISRKKQNKQALNKKRIKNVFLFFILNNETKTFLTSLYSTGKFEHQIPDLLYRLN